jgi:chlorosome envelope protein F
MANENNGVFSDLFNAVGVPVQNVADTLVNGVSSATSLVQTVTNLFGSIISGAANLAIQIIQGVATGITSAIAPKK